MTQPPNPPYPGPWQTPPPDWNQDPHPAPAAPSALSQYWWVILIGVSLVAIVAALLLRPSDAEPAPVDSRSQEATQPAEIPDSTAQSTDPAYASSAPSTPEATASESTEKSAIGEMVNIADLEITLLSVTPGLTKLGGGSFSEEPVVGEFVTVDLRFTNLSPAEISISYGGVALYLADGEKYDADYSVMVHGTYMIEHIPPTETFEGMLFFDVPLGSTFDSLKVSGGRAGGKTVYAEYDLSGVA